MPEEINRIATDALAYILWTPSSAGDENLLKEGISISKIDFVGNIMIDSLEMMRETNERQNTFEECGQKRKGYAVITFHHPSDVDDPEL